MAEQIFVAGPLNPARLHWVRRPDETPSRRFCGGRAGRVTGLEASGWPCYWSIFRDLGMFTELQTGKCQSEIALSKIK